MLETCQGLGGANLPKKSNISYQERKDWLELSEHGERLEAIAKEAKRDQRTVKDNIEKARQERGFEIAQHDQLRGALHTHQQDMLGLLDRLLEGIVVPPLDHNQTLNPDFGLEDLMSSRELSRNSELPFGSAVVKRDGSGPSEVLLTEEDSRLWEAVKQHLRRDPLWRHISAWKAAFLEELQARAVLNQAIRLRTEKDFGLEVQWDSRHEGPYLGAQLVSWARIGAMKSALGQYVPDLAEEVREVEGGRLETGPGQGIATRLEDTAKAKEQLLKTVGALSSLPEVDMAVRAYHKLQDVTGKVHEALEECVLIHHVPGRCDLCKKLGA